MTEILLVAISAVIIFTTYIIGLLSITMLFLYIIKNIYEKKGDNLICAGGAMLGVIIIINIILGFTFLKFATNIREVLIGVAFLSPILVIVPGVYIWIKKSKKKGNIKKIEDTY